MAVSDSNIAVRVGADLTPLQKDMQRAKASMSSFGKKAEAISGAMKGMALAAAAAGAAVTAIAKASGDAAREVQNLSRLSNVSTENFQRLAFAAKEVGVQQDKLADIFKDAQDKVGDFLATGAGPLADYFEIIAPKVGQTAEQFRNLSGPQILGKLQEGLDRTGQSMSQQIFYLEAIASDSSLLQPLLTDNAKGFNELAKAADKVNAVLSDAEIEKLSELTAGFDKLATQISSETSRAVVQFDEEIKTAIEGASQGISALARGFNLFFEQFRSAENKKSIEGINEEIADLFERRDELNRLIQHGNIYVNKEAAREELEEVKAGYDALIERKKQLMSEGQSDFEAPEDVSLQRIGPAALVTPESTEVLSAELQRQNEIVSEAYAQMIEREREAHAAITAIQEKEHLARRMALTGALGDAAALMNTKSRKMFEIGKAAALANATIGGVESAVEAWRSGMETPGPFAPVVAAAYTAASLAKTGALIQAIQSTSFRGGGGGGVGGSGGTASSAAAAAAASGGRQQEPNQIVSINLEGEVFGREQVRGLIGQINDALDEGMRLRVN